MGVLASGCATGTTAGAEDPGNGTAFGPGTGDDGAATGTSADSDATDTGTPSDAAPGGASAGMDPVAGAGNADDGAAGSDASAGDSGSVADDGSAGSDGGTGSAGSGAMDAMMPPMQEPPPPADPCALDSDGDSIGDCDEEDDGDDFTDPAIFNGVHVQTRDQSDNDITCGMIDSLAEVFDAIRGSADQELDQYAGWDFDDAGNNRTDPGYGFQPPWTNGNSSWQIDAVGHINLADGHHCFEVAGETDESCGTLFVHQSTSDGFGGWDTLDGATMADAQHGSGVVCMQLSAGVYPIRWHYEMDNRTGAQSMHLRYCHDASADCTPSEALPARMLRVSP